MLSNNVNIKGPTNEIHPFKSMGMDRDSKKFSFYDSE
jgi:hypothetical protein